MYIGVTYDSSILENKHNLCVYILYETYLKCEILSFMFFSLNAGINTSNTSLVYILLDYCDYFSFYCMVILIILSGIRLCVYLIYINRLLS